MAAISDLFDLFLKVPHAALATVGLDQNAERVLLDTELIRLNARVPLRFRYQVLLNNNITKLRLYACNSQGNIN